MQNRNHNTVASNSLIEKFVNKFRKEGVDHIRVSARAETHIGRICSPDWHKPFFIPYVGEFLSAECFANWIISGGDEEARHNPRYRTRGNVNLQRQLVAYAKFFQLTSIKSSFQKRKEEMALPFAMYNLHPNGIKEFSPWREYAGMVKGFIQHIAENGSKAEYDWEAVLPGIKALVTEKVENIAKMYKADDVDAEEPKEALLPEDQQPDKDQEDDELSVDQQPLDIAEPISAAA